jgi:hypothetical protein
VHFVRVTTTEGTVGLVAHVDSETRLKFIRGEALEPETWKTAPKFRRFQRAEFDVTTQQLTQLPDATELLTTFARTDTVLTVIARMRRF